MPLRPIRQILKIVPIWVALSIGVAAQTKSTSNTGPLAGGATIMGRVVMPDGKLLTQPIRVRLETSRGVNASIFTDSDGKFQFTDLSSGSYQLIVDGDGASYDTTTQAAEVVRGLPVILTVVLKEKNFDPKEAKSGTVSTAELDQQVPNKARKEFERASKASNEGKTDDAIAHLRSALTIYPNYIMARNDLAAQLMQQQKLDEAENELRAALEIDKSAFNPTLNLGVVLVRKHRFTEAVDFLNRAVSLQSSSPAARLYLGLALLGSSDLDRAEPELKNAYALGGSEYAIALFHLSELCLNRGDRNLAREYLQRYLQEAPGARDAREVQRLVALLK